MHLFVQTLCSLRVCFFIRQSKHTSTGEPMRPQGWFWGEEMCIYLSAGCWLTLSPAWIQRCRLASAEKYSVCACTGVCVSRSPAWQSQLLDCLPAPLTSCLISMPPLVSLAPPIRPKWARRLKNVKSNSFLADGAQSFSPSLNLLFFVLN